MQTLPLNTMMTCTRCGYSLRGQVVGSPCPECGTPVAMEPDPGREQEIMLACHATGSGLRALSWLQVWTALLLIGGALAPPISVVIVGFTGYGLAGGYLLWAVTALTRHGDLVGLPRAPLALAMLRFLAIPMLFGGLSLAGASIFVPSGVIPFFVVAFGALALMGFLSCMVALPLNWAYTPVDQELSGGWGAGAALVGWGISVVLLAVGTAVSLASTAPGAAAAWLLYGGAGVALISGLIGTRSLGIVATLAEQDRLRNAIRLPGMVASSHTDPLGHGRLNRGEAPTALPEEPPIPLADHDADREITYIPRSINPPPPPPTPARDEPDVY